MVDFDDFCELPAKRQPLKRRKCNDFTPLASDQCEASLWLAMHIQKRKSIKARDIEEVESAQSKNATKLWGDFISIFGHNRMVSNNICLTTHVVDVTFQIDGELPGLGELPRFDIQTQFGLECTPSGDHIQICGGGKAIPIVVPHCIMSTIGSYTPEDCEHRLELLCHPVSIVRQQLFVTKIEQMS